MNKQSFTLIEILISISLLAIIVLFLYQTLDVTTKSNKFFQEKLSIQEYKTNLKKIFFKDIIYSYSIKTEYDKNKNIILDINTSNTYHDSFYNNITYLISKDNNLLRIESKNKFKKDKLYDEFFDTSYIDTIAIDVNKFKVTKTNDKQYAIYLKFKDESDMMFTFKSIR